MVPLASGSLNNLGSTTQGTPTLPYMLLGVFLIMAGLVIGGSWLTMQAARVLARNSRGASSLLASRRLADNPKAAFRTVSGLVLAVFVASSLASILPVINAAQTSLGGKASSLTNVLRVPYGAGFGPGLTPGETAKIVHELQASPGVTVLPIYVDPTYRPGGPPAPPPGPGLRGRAVRHPLSAQTGQYDSIVSCAGLRAFPALGQCAPGGQVPCRPTSPTTCSLTTL